MVERKNDWVATLLNIEDKPELNDTSLLYANGITPDNTGIKDSDYYKNIPQVQERFKAEDGKFDEKAYNDFYNSALRSYNEYSNSDFTNKLLDAFGTSPYDISILSNPSQYVVNTSALITNFYDRNRHSYGTGNLWEMGNANFSDIEVAQANYVRDENGNILDWTPNDRGGLLKGLFRPTLVYASWDEEGDEIINGRVVHHQKGELKLDQNGDPYTQILGDKDAYGKDVVHYSDTLTVEGTKLNKWDPFDSDGLDKNIWATVGKTAFLMAPFFVSGVGPVLGALSAIGGIASSLPTVAKAVDGFITGSDNDSFGRSMTKIENYMSRFGGSQSDASRGRIFSPENIGEILTTSAGQLFSQRVVGAAPTKIAEMLGKTNKGKKLGQQLSLGYMALTSATDSYGAFKDAGASDSLAGLGMIATIGGFWGLMNTGYFKDKLFEGTLLDEEQGIRRNLRELAVTQAKEQWGTDLNKVVFKPGGTMDTWAKSDVKIAQFLANTVKGAKEFARRMPVGKAGGTENAFVSRMINEGVEEWMEEVMQDSVKGLAKGFEALGFNVTETGVDTLDFGINPDEMMKRWASSFVGGALGGGTFELFNQMELLKNPTLRNYYKMPALKRMTYDLQDPENLEKYVSTIKKMGKRNQLGNKNLSATDYTIVNPVSKDGSNRAYQSGTEQDNQNLAMQNFLIGVANNINYLATTEGLVQNSEFLIRSALTNPTLQDKIKESGLSVADYWKNNGADVIIETLHEMGMFDSVLRDARNIGTEILEIRQDMDRYRAEKGSEIKDPANFKAVDESLKDDPYYKALSDRKEALQNEYKEIISGKRADKYVGFAHMMLDDSPMKYFTNLTNSTVENGKTRNFTTVENFAKNIYHIDYNTLEQDSSLKSYIDDKFKDFMDKNERTFWNIYNFYETLSDKYTPELNKADKLLKDAKLDAFHGDVTIGTFVDRLRAKIDIETKELQDTVQEHPELLGTREYTEAIEQLHQLEARVEFYNGLNPSAKLNTFFNFDRLLEEFGDKDFTEGGLNRNYFVGNEQINAGKEQVKNYYNYLKDNKVVSANYDYLAEFFRKVQLVPNPTLLNNVQFQFPTKAIIQALYPDVDLSSWNDEAEDPTENWMNLQELNPGVFDNLDLDIIAADAMQKYLGSLATPEKRAQLSEEAANIQALLRTDPVGARQKYDELVKRLSEEIDWNIFNEFVKTSNLDHDYDAETFVKELVFLDGENLMPLVSEIEEIVNSSVKSPIVDLLKDLSITINGEENNIIQFIAGEKEKLRSIDNLDSYVVSEEGQKALEDAQTLLNVLTALVDGSQSNLNAKVNQYREKNNKTRFAVISDQTAQILKADIIRIQSQLNFLASLAGMNLTKNLTKQQDIMRVDTLKRVKFFVDPPEEYKPIILELANILGGRNDYFSDIWGDFNLKNITKENFAEFDGARAAFESRLYNDFKVVANHTDKIKAIIDLFAKLQSGNDSIFISTNAGLLTDEENVVLTPYGMFRYLALVLSADTNEVLSYYKQVNQNAKYVPLYTQELIIRDAWATHYDPYNIYSNLADKTKELIQNNKSEFIKDCDYLDNFLFINGVPGAGKTAVIANTIKKMIRLKDGNNNKTTFVSISITKEQTDKLANAIEEPTSGLLWSEVQTKIGTKFEGEIKDKGGHQIVDKITTTDDLKALIDSDADNIVIFFDEVTLASELELRAFNQYINKLIKNGKRVTVFGLGDLNQPSAQVDGNEVSMTNLVYQSSFRLTASFRETNEGKYYNTEAVYGKVNAVQENLYKDKEFALSDANTLMKQALEESNISLQHYDNGKEAFGDFQITKENVKNTVNKLKTYVASKYPEDKRAGKIAIVVNNNADRESYEREYQNDIAVKVVELRDLVSVQGGEFDYVIGDADLEYGKSAFQAAKRFYMLMSRARNATFFTESSVLPGIRFDLQDKPSAGSLLKTSDDERQNKIYTEYRDWRMALPSLNTVASPVVEVSTPRSEDSTQSGVSSAAIPAGGTPAVEPLQGEKLDTFVQEAVGHPVNSLDEEALGLRRSKSGKEKVESLQDLISIKKDDADGEVFVEWLSKHNPLDQNGLRIVNVNPATRDNDIDAQVIEYTQYAASYIRHHAEGELLSDYVGAGLAESNLFSETTQELQSAINTGSGFYYVTELDDKRSLIYYVFKDSQKAIPVSIVNGKYNGRYKTLKWNLEVAPAVLSSRGERWTKLLDLAKGKLSILNYYAHFLGANGKAYTEYAERFLPNKGKSFQLLIPTLNRAKEYHSVEEFLTPTVENGYVSWWTNRASSVRTVGVQRRIDFDTLQHWCDLLNTANGFGETTDIENAKREIENIFGLDPGSYIPINSKNITDEQWSEMAQNEEDGSEPNVKRTRIPLLGYEARPNFMKAFIRAFGNANGEEDNGWMILFQNIKESTPSYKNRFRVVRFDFTDGAGFNSLYFKINSDDAGGKVFTLIDPSNGNEDKQVSFAIAGPTPADTFQGFFKQIVDNIVSLSKTNSFLQATLSILNGQAPDTTNWTNISYDFEEAGYRKDNNNFARFRQSIPVIMRLAEQMSKDSDKLEVFKKYLSEYFKHGFYIELIGKKYLNSEENVNDANWAVSSIDTQDSDILTDIGYILAPIYSVQFGESLSGNEIESLSVAAKADQEIKGDRKYTIDESGKYLFENTYVNRDWVRNNAKEGLPNLLNISEDLQIISGEQTDSGFQLQITAAGVGTSITLKDRSNFLASVTEIVPVKNLGSIGNGIDFIVSNNELKLQYPDGSTKNVAIVGVQDNGVFFKEDNEIKFVSGAVAQSVISDEDIQTYVSKIRDRGYALGDVDGNMLYIRYDEGTPVIDMYENGNIITYRSYGDSWRNGDSELILNESVTQNIDTYINNNLGSVEAFKEVVQNNLNESLTNEDWALDIIAKTDFKNAIGKLDSIDSVINYINQMFYESRFLSNNGTLIQIDKSGSVIEKIDPEILVGNQILTRDSSLQPTDIKKITIEESNQNTITYFADINRNSGVEHVHQKLSKQNGRWTTIDLSTQDTLKSVISESLQNVQSESARSYFTRYFEGLLSGNVYKPDAYSIEFEKLTEDEQDVITTLLETIEEDVDCLRTNNI